MHEAAAKGKFDICKLLLKHGADPNKKNRDGHTPLDLVKEGDEDVADLLRGEAALLEAAKKGSRGRDEFKSRETRRTVDSSELRHSYFLLGEQWSFD